MYRYINVGPTPSTNSFISLMAGVMNSGTIVYTEHQSAGRGQRGNSWEAEPGKNLSFSLLVKEIPINPARQFLVSEAVALALLDVLDTYADGFSIKWPNDIYWRDSKISGTLIENALQGSRILYSIIGVGLNVNQAHFISDAPNPISLCHITGGEHQLEPLLHDIGATIERRLDPLMKGDDNEAALAEQHRQYLSRLYRHDGKPHPFALPDSTLFDAVITDVRPDGCLLLTDAATSLTKPYYFKGVAFAGIPASRPL